MALTDRDTEIYKTVRGCGSGFIEVPRGLIAVSGKEAVQFLDGMITNDVKTLEDGQQMLAAFPNAQGRLLALVRILRQGDRFLIETEDVTREKVYRNLFRFTFAGDFFVEDLSESYRFFELTPPDTWASTRASLSGGESDQKSEIILFDPIRSTATLNCMPKDTAGPYRESLIANGCVEISPDLHETLRIESGIPKYGVDMDENTIVPELGLDGMISYTKGCYIGQEIIARIHFRGHVAKQLTGLLSVSPAVAGGFTPSVELTAVDGKNTGWVTSTCHSPGLGKDIALGFVRYNYLAAGTKLLAGETDCVVHDLPFDRGGR